MGWRLNFDGIDDNVIGPVLEPTSFTAEFIANLPGLATPDTSSVSHHFYPSLDGWGITSIDAWVSTSGGRQFLPSVTDMIVDKTEHRALTYDQSSGAARLYINGVLNSSLDLSPGTVLVYGGGAIHLSHVLFETYGFLDNARLYSRALDADEVAQHARGIFSDNTGLLLHWALDTGSGTTATDGSGNGNDGTISGASWVSGNLFVNKVMMTVWEHAGEVALDDPIQYTAAVIDGVTSSAITGSGKKRRRVRLFSNVDAWVKWGENPTATGGSDSMALSANNPEYVDIESGHILHAISR